MNGITLESAEEAFRVWRIQRSSRVASIPENLWRMALELYPHYKRSKICHRLRLSGAQFKRRLESDYPAVADNGFVLASRDEVKEKPKPSPEIHLTLQGKERSLTFRVGVDSFGQILPHICTLL
jgi:hypothetical protein